MFANIHYESANMTKIVCKCRASSWISRLQHSRVSASLVISPGYTYLPGLLHFGCCLHVHQWFVKIYKVILWNTNLLPQHHLFPWRLHSCYTWMCFWQLHSCYMYLCPWQIWSYYTSFPPIEILHKNTEIIATCIFI